MNNLLYVSMWAFGGIPSNLIFLRIASDLSRQCFRSGPNRVEGNSATIQAYATPVQRETLVHTMPAAEPIHFPKHREPIAIIGSGCRFPGGASSPSKLWDLLREPRDVLSEIPASRFDTRGFYHPNHTSPGHSNVRHSYLLDENVAEFDAQFFGLHSAEAAAMDPQQRILLETVYEGLEAAGLTIEGLKGSDTGVYVGMMYGDYESLQYRDLQSIPTYHGLALHQAVQALRSGEVHVAVAAGTNLLLGPEPYIYESKLQMLSPDGRSRMWDQGANGYARGDGVGCIILKTLSEAIANGDNIDAVIRETGVNQDGRSRGITMPTVKAQAALIRETYARAGLDPASKADRCQFFEAHGTGTPAGDPIEAEAIHTAFFGHLPQGEEGSINCTGDDDKLLVGSIKTIIGHTESTAGIAGILKVVEALKHGYVPANMHLTSLNPRVAPWYQHLHIPQQLTPWPELQDGQRRRASVNSTNASKTSFGFGGTNAHVILEDFGKDLTELQERALFTPFVFSAQSKQSMLANLTAYVRYLEQNPETDVSNLAWMLRSRRSRLPLRVSFPVSSIDALRASLHELTGNINLASKSATAGSQETRLLGIFTGQGAQWPRMGAELVEKSTYAAKILSDLDEALAELPQEDRPNWTLREELLAERSSSSVGKASISQPLCTAIQVILVDLLGLAGIHFSVVVGHSSGEIACAYAAGHLSARDAIRIAYYRGLHSHLASSPNGTQGCMVAVGTSLEDAELLCNDEVFAGRIKVAACNSPSSITLSGDEDAAEEIMEIFQDENRFVRRLVVDKAYHSHHMVPCSKAYLESMEAVSIQTIQNPETGCTWVSSVYPDQPLEDMGHTDSQYWVDNLLSPVLFKQAVERAASLGPFDGAIEVGPHPALKGPVRETLQDLKIELPYTGLLQRNTDAISSTSSALGYLWVQLDNLNIDFDQYERTLGGAAHYRFLPELPRYQWNHSQAYWHESSISRNLRQRGDHTHPLLGDLLPHSTSEHLTWKNILRPQDLPWIHQHQIQGQSVFPAAGYAATAIESAKFLCAGGQIQLIEIENLAIHQAMVFDKNNEESGIEVQFSISNIKCDDQGCVSACFTYESQNPNRLATDLVASGTLCVVVGAASQQLLPATEALEAHMIDVPTEVFYSSLQEVGYGYSGPFQAISDLKRKLGKASGSLAVTTTQYGDDGVLLVHPSVLDAAIHSIILAYSYPRDGQLWSLHLPTQIQRIRIDPSTCGNNWLGVSHVPFVATIPDTFAIDRSSGFCGDVEVHCTSGGSSSIQVEGLRVVPFTEATSSDDKNMFYSINWVEAEPNADIPGPFRASSQDIELATILERGHYFYLRQLESQIPEAHPGRSDPFFAAYLNWASHTHSLVTQGRHRYGKKEWINDTQEDIDALTAPFSDRPEVRAMRVVGEQMPRAICGETTMLEHLMTTGLLTDYYARALGMSQIEVLAETVHQVVQRYPQAEILEVGAGTGGATREVLKRIGHEFGTYTFTDVSAGFFDDAQNEFSPFRDRMPFRVLDLEQDTKAQGFELHGYDIVIGSLVLHTTKNLEETCRRVRSLLKPGGYLIFYEITNVDLIRHTALFGCLPGWWAGMDEGRTLIPAVDESHWDALLRKTGFSGVDTMTPLHSSMPFCNSVMVSQAINEKVEFLRDPLMAQPSLHQDQSAIKHLFLVGGATLQISRLVEDIYRLIQMFCDNITRVKSLEELDYLKIDKDATVLVLQDLDQPVFKDINSDRLEALKRLFGSEKTVMWVSKDRLVGNPYSNMPAGFVRPSIWETPELRYQFVDFEGVQKIDARALTEALLRFQGLGSIHEPTQKDLLWSIESEIVLNAEGRQLIPRLKPMEQANQRYNSTLRAISMDARPGQEPVVVSAEDGKYALLKKPLEADPMDTDGDEILIRVSHSSLNAVKTQYGNVVVLLGTSSVTGQQFVSVSDSPTSLVKVDQSGLISVAAIDTELQPLFIRLVSAHLLLSYLVRGLTKEDTLVLHNAPTILRRVLDSSNHELKGKFLFTTSSLEVAREQQWINLGSYMRQSQLKALLPGNISQLIDFTMNEESPGHASLVSSLSSAAIQIVKGTTLFADRGVKDFFSADGARTLLKQAADAAMADIASWQHGGVVSAQIRAANLHDIGRNLELLTVIDWSDSSLAVSVHPVRPHLKPNRTYWLVGLSRDMGLSLADYLIEYGAKNLVITSRSPDVDPAWLEKAERNGATTRIMSCDVTNYESLSATLSDIRSCMPPVAGIAHGAMVLRDVLIRDMTMEELVDVLRPKVEGSLNLDRLFHDDPLDFFIFFSSAAAVTGNAGQANYAAANFFMASLAEQRRRRGVAASVIDLGPVLGTGYITREIGDALTRPLAERGLLGMSERDVHHIFAEAVNASNPKYGSEGMQITTGLIPLPATATNRPLWYNFPHFACLSVRDAEDTAESANNQSRASIKDRLVAANSKDEVEIIIRESFIDEMRNMLHLGDDYAITTAVRTDELGLDSLVAVRIRSWFLKNYQFNIPALRIMKGTSLQELIELALDGIPDDLTPQLSSSADGQPQSSSKETPGLLNSIASLPGSSDTGKSTSSPEYTTEHSSVSGQSETEEKTDEEMRHETQPTRFGRLSYTQSVFMFTHELLDDKTTLNNTGMVHLRGNVRTADLAKAVQIIAHRHETLRTCIRIRDGRPVQAVMETSTVKLEHKRIHTREDLDKEYDALRKHAFDLASGRHTRVILFSHSARDHYFALSTHHIIFDRASTDIFMSDLQLIYDSQCPLIESPLQYLDYSEQQYVDHSSGKWEDSIAFWKNEFETIPDLLPLHRSRISERRPLERYQSWTPEFRIDAKLAQRIRQDARKFRSTPFHFHLAAFKTLLVRWLGTDDICIGMADGCRRDERAWSGIGPFLNMLPLRLRPQSRASSYTFNDLMVEARDKSHAALEHAIPFELILDELSVARTATHTPLAQAFLNYAETSVESSRSFLGCDMQMLREDQAELPYDIALTVINNAASETRVILNVQASLYSEADATLLAHGYEDIIKEFAQAPDAVIKTPFKFREEALQKAVAVGRGPHFTPTWPQTLVHRFEQLLPSISDRVAVTDDENNSFSYEEVLRRTNCIARELMRYGIGHGAKVAIFQHPSAHWVASVLAILKVGAVYVPLDAATPVARLALIVKDCQPLALLVHGHTADATEGLSLVPGIPIIDVTDLTIQPTEQISIQASSTMPAIILYTSGSTGTPKGVILSHASLCHEFSHCAATYQLGVEDVVLQQSAWSFDLSVTQLFLAVTIGARLHMVSHLLRPDAGALVNLIQHQAISTTYATPTEYKSWLRHEHQQALHRAPAWRLALVAGEAVTEPLLKLFRDIDRSKLRLVNVYGPTETTCGSTKMELNYQKPELYGDIVPVGPASANEWFYIVDQHLNLQPVGQAGEVVIGGMGVAMGYLNDHERTEASFVPDTFGASESVKHSPPAMMYRTGDLGYLKPDGSLVIQGRIGDDTEIKLNGVRIDLRDIEQTVLRAADGQLVNAAATLRTSPAGGAKFMVVFVVFASSMNTYDGNIPFLRDLRRSLPLPSNMLPSAIIHVNDLPRTVAGKLDRNAVAALSAPSQMTNGERVHGLQLSHNETRLRELWRGIIPGELWELYSVESDLDFFSMGGNSMQLIELQHMIRDQLGLNISLLDLFKANTLGAMAQLLELHEGKEQTAANFEFSENTHIDWEAETAIQPGLDESILPPFSRTAVQSPPRTIVLTGATGFLGQHLLEALMGHKNIQHVICIANRGLSNPERVDLFARYRAAHPDVYLECLEGDLRKPRLGLSPDEAKRIFDTTDAVIHNGADVSHLKTYASLRTANVASTRELMVMCETRRVPLHYISTTGVVMYTDQDAVRPMSVKERPPPRDGRYGYVASKWASEVYLEKMVMATAAVARDGTTHQKPLPVYIHRPSSVLRPDEQMQEAGERPADDVVQNMLLYAKRVGAVPDASGLRKGFVDLVQPSTVVEGVLNAVMSHGSSNMATRLTEEGRVVFIHESGDVEVDLSNITEYLSRETGRFIKQVSLADWLTLVENAGLSSAMAAVFRALGAEEGLNFPRLLKE
ncbi:beta-ketoacyl synthase domain-containing protein [Paramyrothecium foliicola]|nr:beta-ketoacyl synthase domain-containing protein [Paramyrothecium foliicola]